MSGFCLGIAFSAIQAVIPAETLTLAWTHSVEKVRWEEDYRTEQGRLVLVEARVKGMGAGMEPAPDAVLRDGWWRWRPDRDPMRKISLARSVDAGDYTLCWNGRCETLAGLVGPPSEGVSSIDLFPCPGDGSIRLKGREFPIDSRMHY